MHRIFLVVLLAANLGWAGNSEQILASGVQKENFDEYVRPQDDFFRHVNGTWLEETEIPADKSNYGAFTALHDQAQKDLRMIIQEAAKKDAEEGSESQKVGDLYISYMDTVRIEKLGLEPLQSTLRQIEAISDYDDLQQVMIELRKIGVQIPFRYYVSQDRKQSDRYVAYVSQSGLGLPDRDYYFKEDAKFKSIREKYQTFIEKLLSLAEQNNAAEQAAVIYDLEKRMAEHHWTRVQNRDPNKTYNKFSIAQMDSLTPDYSWRRMIRLAGIPEAQTLVVQQPDYLQAFGELYRTVPVEDWRTYLYYKTLAEFAGVLPDQFAETRFDFYGRILSGTEQMEVRWKRAVSAVNSKLGEVVGKIYVKKHFDPQAKERMETLVANLLKAYEARIKELEWMGEETKEKALVKLSKFNYKIGYPDKWKDYSELKIEKETLLQNFLRANRFHYNLNIDKLGKPIDRDEWFMYPQTVNAYYNPSMNEVVFPAAILQPPFFNMEADDAVNYGAIGAVIGHEITHGFDDQGRKFDGEGNLNNWWSENDMDRFSKRSQGLVKQYEQYVPVDTMHLNGELTLGENIADLGGLSIAYQAYKRSLNGEEAPVIDGFTGDQRFFIGWAQVWRRKYREDEMRKRVLTDPHSPSEYRVIGVLSNMPEFYEAFDVQKGDRMYRPEDEIVKIW